MTVLPPLMLDPEVLRIATTLEDAGYETWCVGGALRDRLLGDDASDIDLATAATPDQVLRLFRRTVPVGIRFGTVGVLDQRSHLHEVTTFRKDVSTDGRHAVVEFGVSLEEDLARRDFTVNAMAYHPLREEWQDPLGGQEDIARRLIRAVGDPARRFEEDHLRILRAIRFAARFDFAIEPATWSAARARAERLKDLSAERVREEWVKGLGSCRDIGRLVRLWHECGAAAVWLPELVPADAVPSGEPPVRDPVMLTAALATDPAGMLQRLRASNREIDRAAHIAAGPAAPADTDERTVRRWLAAVDTVAADLASIAEYRVGRRPGWWEVAMTILERGDPVRRQDLAVDGRDLMTVGISPGPSIGKVIDSLLDQVLDDPRLNSRERLLGLAAAWNDERH